MNNLSLAHILTGTGTEFFSVQNEAYVVHGRKVVTIDEAPKDVTDTLYRFMTSSKERINAYKSMAGDDVSDQMKQCIKCMFANLDGYPDIDDKGRMSNTEFIQCDKRSTCEFYGVGCNKLTAGNGNEISKGELRVLELCHLDEKEIANKLFLSPQTVSRHSQNIRIKTGISSGKEMALWALNKGVINQSQLCIY